MSAPQEKSAPVDTMDDGFIEKEFAQAIGTDQLSLHYQPIIDLSKRSVSGFEALMRWKHPVKGQIPPSVFIPVAEASGLINQASQWALREACRALKRIETKVGLAKLVYMSVNFSPSDFEEENFLEQIYTILSETDLNPNKVCLEISESLLTRQPEASKESLGMCRRAGLGITLDDFSKERLLDNRLSGYPVNAVKIDRAHVSSMMENDTAKSIAEMIVAYGAATNIKVIAEGVETEGQMDFLAKIGCPFAQGYYFSRPYSELELTEKLENWAL